MKLYCDLLIRTIRPLLLALLVPVTDSHNCQRFISGGFVKNEGDVQKRLTKPFPVSYRSLVPKISECKNLLTPWSVSASHVAFASVRMEPVFMILGQSAGTAACMAIDEKCAVQNVPYAELKGNQRSAFFRTQTPQTRCLAHIDDRDRAVEPGIAARDLSTERITDNR